VKDLYRQMVKTAGIQGGLYGAVAAGLPSAIAGGLHGAVSGYLANRDDPDVGNRTLNTAGYGALVAGVPMALLGAYGGHKVQPLIEAAAAATAHSQRSSSSGWDVPVWRSSESPAPRGPRIR